MLVAEQQSSNPLAHAFLKMQSEKKLDAIGAAIGTSGASVADELMSMREALVAAALALEQAKAEARREMAALIAVFACEVDELESEYEDWREEALGE
eukprot:scaffold163508_cov27-Tisochrysis_lutea.AAC.3